MMPRSPVPRVPLSPLSFARPATAGCFDPALAEAPGVVSACHLFGTFVALAREKGFSHLAYGVRLPIPLTHQKYMVFHNGCTAGSDVPCESLQLDEDEMDGSDTVSSLRKIMQPDAGSADGNLSITAAAHHFSGATGTLWLQHGTADPPPVCQLTVFALANLIHTAMTECLLRQYVPESLARITGREKEILRWTADGKTVGEISQIISISERTVKFHLSNIMGKLNSINKTQATVKASALGLLRN